MSRFSDYFREMESVGEEQRKSAILLALIASLDDQTQGKKTDIHQFTELFKPLFKAATADSQRKAISALSRISHVPGRISEFICEQPLDLSAPFLSHSPALTDAILCYIIAIKPHSYATLIAKRDDLSARVVRALLAINNPGVNRALQLRGYTKNLTLNGNETLAQTEPNVNTHDFHKTSDKKVRAGVVEFFDNIGAIDDAPSQNAPIQTPASTDNSDKTGSRNWQELGYELFDEQWELNKTARQAEDSLRDTLRELVSDISAPLDPEQLLAANQDTSAQTGNDKIVDLPILLGEMAHRRHVAILQQHIENTHVEYFTTGLADALGSSYQLAERIMSDMSGRQLALTFTAILLPSELCLTALNKFFPHVGLMEGTDQGADALMLQVEHIEALNRLLLWIKADKMSNGAVDIEVTDVSVEYKPATLEELPYVAPVADNSDDIDEDIDQRLTNQR